MQLVELHESGALSDDEFAAMRQEVLSGKASSRMGIAVAVGLVVVALGVVGALVVAFGGTTATSEPTATTTTTTSEPTTTMTTPTTEVPIPTTTVVWWWDMFLATVNRLDDWCYSDCKSVDGEALDYHLEQVDDLEDLRDVTNHFKDQIVGYRQPDLRLQCASFWERESNYEYLQRYNTWGFSSEYTRKGDPKLDDTAYMWASYLVCDS